MSNITSRFKLNLGAWSDGLGEVDFYLLFTDISHITHATETFTQIDLTYEWNGTRELSALIDDEWELYDDDNITDLAETGSGGIIEFDGNLYIDDARQEEMFTWFQTAIDCGFLSIGVDGQTLMLLFRLNDEKEHINKKLILVRTMTGNFKAPLGIKNIEIDVVGYDIENSYNYIYIPKLKRYYYVTNIQFINKDYTRLILQEDVLMSWKTLIGQQEALITRYGGASDFNLYDNRFPLKDIPTVEYNGITNYTGSDASTIIEFKYLMGTVSGQTTKKPNVFMSTVGNITEILPDDTNNIEAPTNSYLPNIQSRRGGINHNYLMNIQDYNFIVNACINNDAPASYIRSILLLPFDLTDIFTDATRSHGIYAGTKQVLYTGWGDPTSDPAPETWETKLGACPYIVVADFYFNANGGINITNTYLDNAPNTQWEMYLPFVGWVQIDPRTLYNDRIMVYYTFDFDTGMSTAYIYNRTKQKTVWSGSCQIGMRLAIATTNADELARQKQATGLNLLMGLMTSALSIGVGAYSGNAVAVAGGLMGIGKTVTGAVNSFNSMIQRAQISYGSSDNALYSANKVVVRKTTHDQILTTPDQITKYIKINGYPYRDYKLISSLTADKYFEVGEIHFDAKGENIYSDEITEIVQLLKNGVIM